MLAHRDIKGIIGIVPTPAKPGADDWRKEDTVDFDEAARVTNQLIKDGVGCMLTNGTTGEASTLLWEEEHKPFAEVVIETARKRVPLFIGVTTLGTRESIRRARHFVDMGADGILLGIPMWQAPTMEEAVAHYKMVSEAVPNANIIVYANTQAFRFAFPPAFWGIMHREVPAVIGAKYGNMTNLLASLAACENSINLAPVYSGLYQFSLLSPETSTACWSHVVQLGPMHAMLDAVGKGDMAKAKEVQDDFQWARSTQDPPLSPEVFGQFNIQLEKLRMDAAGYCKAGPMRPPYHLIPEKMAEGAREAGRRWKVIAEKYANVPVAR